MQKATSPKLKSFSLYAIVSAAMIAGGTLAAVLAGVSPANAASLATQPDTQVMVFMIPLTLLVLAMLFEVARFALRGTLPAHAPARKPVRRYWSPGHNEG
ncbi:hypothetical protein PSC71_18415 [Devosia sp. J2-20]|jgi:asparagine N-glycosylation enzyme membrane subunit Stt3|uniref:Uncharacterized protein n=1 Tax=Devosia litorisediminis TaxID=2829817 RepID=A0A942I4S0_9HYPH|nr:MULTISPECIES: hypothetical protein [Devosia]MBS3847761.1 hypothetical protein [Devosia litorisediminis]MCZ4345737.1 hypothetical protein [Devosia neptuniae]WDQ99124.1 hypothetical protein PSC71_18415 [Devosia sp. J2-20]|tara:strand:- start:253 stop:552 length:300 start_codon:yes stop_codon:yes gene_type:complete